MEIFNGYYLKKMLLGLLGWIVLSSFAIGYGAAFSLFDAVHEGDRAKVELLLTKDLNNDFITQVNDRGQTVLHIASAQDRRDIVNLLLKKAYGVLGEDLVPKFMLKEDENGKTAGSIASKNGYESVVEVIIDQYGLIIRQAGFHSTITTSLSNDLAQFLYFACEKGQIRLVQLWFLTFSNLSFFDECVQIIQAKYNGCTPLHVASQNGHVAVVEELLDAFLAKDASLAFEFMVKVRKDGEAALHIASRKGHFKVVEALLARNTSLQFITQVSKEGWTALHYCACYCGHLKVVEALIAKDTSLQLVMKLTMHGGETALHLASSSGYLKVIQALLDAFLAKDAGLAFDFIMKATYDEGHTALHLASYYGYIEIVKILVSAAPMLLRQKTNSGALALDIALDKGKSDVADYLKQKMSEHGATLNLNTTIAAVASSVQSNDSMVQQAESVDSPNFIDALAQQQVDLRKAVQTIEAELNHKKQECQKTVETCEAAKQELERLEKACLDQQNALREVCEAVEKAEQKNKLASLSPSQQDGSGSIKQEPQNDQKTFMEQFYQNLSKDDIKKAVTVLIGNSRATQNCEPVAGEMIKFFKTGKPPAGLASAKAPSRKRKFQTLVTYERMPLDSGPSEEGRELDHVVRSTMVEPGVHENTMPPNLYFALNEQGDMESLVEIIDLSCTEVPSQRVAFSELDNILKMQARNNPPDNIAFGLINVGFVRRSIDEKHVPVGHQFVYFARPHGVYFIDPPGGRSRGDRKMIFSSTHKWSSAYCGSADKLRETLGEYAFVVPMTINF